MHRDLPPEMAHPRPGRYKETPKLTLLGSLCGNCMEIRSGHSRTHHLYVMGEASRAKGTKLFWDETPTALTWVYIFYLAVHIPKWGAHPLQAPTHVCTPSTPSRWCCPVHEGDLRSSPSFPTWSQGTPPTFAHRHTGGVSLFHPV